jgi:predicted RNase H-like nuclease
MMADCWLAGVDGCPAGWMVAFVRASGDEARLRVVARFEDVVMAEEAPSIIAVDMPIGLPDRIGPGGRGPEAAVRPLLGGRQSSVFSVPSRAAVEAPDYAQACAIAFATSDPPRKVSKQLFMIVPRIREVDAVLRSNPAILRRVFESHPELAFWRLNGRSALDEPKKIRGKPHPAGLALRRRLLLAGGFPQPLVDAVPPRGAAADDLLDALACAQTARRLHSGNAESFPASPARDRFALPIAIWA